MSALDDLFDGHYFTDDPHVYIPIDEARKELAALRNPWQPIETAPESGEILVEDDDGVIHHVEMENGIWVSLSNSLEEVYPVIRWMPLP